MRLINYYQTAQERQEKYWLVKSCGGTVADANKMRDWRLAKIERFFGLTETYNTHAHKYDRELNIPPSLAPSIA